jgi:hypothetical protein
MPKLKGHALTDRQARVIHTAHVEGGGSIDKLAAEIGFSGAAARKRMRKLHLPIATRRDMAAEPLISRPMLPVSSAAQRRPVMELGNGASDNG